VPSHHVIRASDAVPATRPVFEGRAEGLVRRTLVGRHVGSLHSGLAQVRLDADGYVALHVHAFEESVYVVSGTPTLVLDGRALALAPGDGALVPVGAEHGWRAEAGTAEWLEMASPAPRVSGPPDTWFTGAALPGLGESPSAATAARTRGLFHDPGSAHATRPADALLTFGGTTLRMLVDARLGAALHTMFTVQFAPRASLAAHDHPFEETYVVREGRIDATCDGERLTLAAGDALWTGVGCIHAFANPYDEDVRWLETQAPQPPARHAFRFVEQWEALG
jgi:quercetin dioxygenase-like cupin family protein